MNIKPLFSFDLSPELTNKLSHIKLLALDVDGILTNGQVSYDSSGAEHKNFNIKDGLGIKLLQKSGVRVAIITGRVSAMVERRSTELGIDFIIQGREDKGKALTELAKQADLNLEYIAYAGDDLPDYQALDMAGVAFTVADAHPEIAAIVDWVSPLKGGEGAVRQMCETILLSSNTYNQVTEGFKAK